MTTIHRELPYGPSHPRGVGDLFLPGAEAVDPPILLMHGGGWNALAKESIEPFARLFAARNRAVFSINYRLLDHAPWPGCLEDCVSAAEFMLRGGLSDQGLTTPETLIVCGASAGGHLAMMTGLTLGAERIRLILSICGPSRMDFPDGSITPHFQSVDFCRRFLGRSTPPTPEEIADISPCARVRPGAPPLVCIHSRKDRLVPMSHSQDAVAAWHATGASAELIAFDGPDHLHGIWTGEDHARRQPHPAVISAIEHLFPA